MSQTLHSVYYIATLAIGLFSGILLKHLLTSTAQYSSYVLHFAVNIASDDALGRKTSNLASWQAPSALRDYEPLGVEDTDEPWWENFDTNRTIYLSVLYGLGNTIPAIASALTVAHREKINMKFVFDRARNGYNMGPAKWNDLFSFPKINPNHSFPDGEFSPRKTKACKKGIPRLQTWSQIEGRIRWILKEDGSGEYACYTASHWREPPFPESGLWFFRNFHPADKILAYINEFKEQQEWHKYQWIGVHLRRSDNFGWIKTALKYETQEELKERVNTTNLDSMIPLEKYIESMKNIKNNWPIHNLGKEQRVSQPKFYLATDNDHAREKVLDAFLKEEIVFYNSSLFGKAARRDTWGMKVAAIEMYLLASCRVLIGTPFSTFSETSHMMGGNLLLEVNFDYMNMSSMMTP